MESLDHEQRLSRIATLWTVVFQAHGDSTVAGPDARQRLMLRYSAPAYRYLLGAVRDADAAADLCQEFAVRFLRGDFRRAHRDKGRFRDYVKTALSNLVNDYHRTRQAQPKNLAADAPEPAAPAESSDDDFLSGWRQALLDRAWEALAADNPGYHATLLLRVNEPDLPSPEMAERLSAQLGKPVTPENVRKMLQRAHGKFAELLLDEVAASLDSPTKEELGDELRTLNLVRYCQSALDRRK
jgi:RNA polymerase sigma-70 factor (ECF subfamily)